MLDLETLSPPAVVRALQAVKTPQPKSGIPLFFRSGDLQSKSKRCNENKPKKMSFHFLRLNFEDAARHQDCKSLTSQVDPGEGYTRRPLSHLHGILRSELTNSPGGHYNSTTLSQRSSIQQKSHIRQSQQSTNIGHRSHKMLATSKLDVQGCPREGRENPLTSSQWDKIESTPMEQYHVLACNGQTFNQRWTTKSHA